MQLVLLGIALLSGCTGSEEEPGYASVEALMDPQLCASCHPTAFAEWQGSMHAYAAEDPVFLAMNARGQRETNGALGDFCVNCHAPMAVKLGLTTDGLNLASLEPKMKGVTCFYCHQVEAVSGTHNNPLELAMDQTMRGAFGDAVESGVHGSAASSLHDRTHMDSAKLCGSCHDIVAPSGAHVERTYLEWSESLYGKPNGIGLTCGQCHMDGVNGKSTVGFDVPTRRLHSHALPGVDIALTPWPMADVQRQAVQDLLEDTLSAQLCVYPAVADSTILATIENVGAGHSFPSGAAQDRRVWVELHAYDASGAEVLSTGERAPGADVDDANDPLLWQFRDRHFKGGLPVDFQWEVEEVESDLLLGAITTDPNSPDFIGNHRTKRFDVSAVVDRVEAVVHVEPIGADVLHSLVASGDLDPAIPPRMPRFTLSRTRVIWETAAGTACVRPTQ